MTTRPILFVLAKQRLAPILNGLPIIKSLSQTVLALLKTCVEAATTVIKILSLLLDRGLVGMFSTLADLQEASTNGKPRALLPSRFTISLLRRLHSHLNNHILPQHGD